jgi:large subunit ribosomal protein L37Ae
MAVKKKSSTKRFGPRYGGSIKQKLANIERKQKEKYACPKCLKEKVSRISAGIWYCKNCDTKFAGRAYSFKE